MHVTVSTSPAQPSPTSAARTVGHGGRMVALTCVAAASALRCALNALVAFYSGVAFQALSVPVPAPVWQPSHPAACEGCWRLMDPVPAQSSASVGHGISESQVGRGSRAWLHFCWKREVSLGCSAEPCGHRDPVPVTCPTVPPSLQQPPAAAAGTPSLLPPCSVTESHKLRQTLGIIAGVLCFFLRGDQLFPCGNRDSGLSDSPGCLGATNITMFTLLSFRYDTGDVFTEDFGFCFPAVPETHAPAGTLWQKHLPRALGPQSHVALLGFVWVFLYVKSIYGFPFFFFLF